MLKLIILKYITPKLSTSNRNCLALALAVLLFSCQPVTSDQQASNEVPETIKEESVPKATTGKLCFAYDDEVTLIGLTVMMDGNQFTGQLAYAYSDKDRDAGTIDGYVSRDTFIADYTYSAGGKRAVKEVVFLKRDNGLIEGTGDVEIRDGKTVFKNRSALKFESSMPLKAVPCFK